MLKQLRNKMYKMNEMNKSKCVHKSKKDLSHKTIKL